MANDIDAEKDKQTRHNYTMRGMAGEVGMIATNAANPETSLSPEQKKEKQRAVERLIELQQWLDNHLNDLQNRIEQLDIQIDAGRHLLDAYNSGERNFDTPEYEHYLELTGWSIDDLQSGKAEKEHTLWSAECNNLKEEYKTLSGIDRNNVQALESAHHKAGFTTAEQIILDSDFDGSGIEFFDSPLNSALDLSGDFKNAVHDTQAPQEPQPLQQQNTVIAPLNGF